MSKVFLRIVDNWVTAVFAFFVLFAGGMVTSTGSGLAVPDWPLSFGQYFPRMVGGVFFEHGHRMVAGIVGVMTWVLAGWVFLREPRRWVRRAAAAVTVPPGLATLRKAIKVRPDVLREAFLRANPGLPEDGIYIACRGEDLVDVRICLTPSLDFRDCPRVRNRRCRTPVLDVEPPR